MALKDKKNKLGLPSEPSENPDAAAETGAEEPFKVFRTKEEFDSELARLTGNNGAEGYGTITPYTDPQTGAGLYQRPDGRDRIVDEWQSDARKLAIVIPDFDFQAALKNPAFRTALTNGRNVFEAYAEMIRIPDSSRRGGIAQNAQSARRGTGEASLNPAKLSSEDFKKYIDNRRNG